MIATPEQFRDKHKGESCVLFGNGPSLDLYDLTKITCPTIGMNRSWRKFVSDYHCILGDFAYLREIEQGKWTPKVLFVILGKRDEDYLTRWTERHITVGQVVGVPKADNAKMGHGCDLLKGVKPALTGAFAIMVAVFLGFEKIYLLGYDCNPRQGHFRFTGDGKAYTFPGREIHIDRQGQVQQFERLKGIIDEKHPGVYIMNLNPQSAVKCWPFAGFPLVCRKNADRY